MEVSVMSKSLSSTGHKQREGRLPSSPAVIGKTKQSSSTSVSKTKSGMDLEALVRLDHNYCLASGTSELPPSSLPRKAIKVVKEIEVSRFKPIKYLFHREEEPSPTLQKSPSKLEHLLKRTSMYEGPSAFAYQNSSRSRTYSGYYRDEENLEVDVVGLTPDPQVNYDPEKAKVAMNECETHVNFARPTEVSDDWEEQIVKTGWTKIQRHLFKTVMKALHSEHFVRLVYEGNASEAILRRNSLDLTSQCVRKSLTKVCWDGKLTQWLHGVLIDNLSHHYLAIYLDVLQTLRTKAPALVDRMIVLSTVAGKTVAETIDPPVSTVGPQREGLAEIINAEAIHLLIKRQWDPFSSVTHTRGIKLICNPIFLFVPAGPSWGQAVNIRRHKNFVNMISNLGKVITVTMAPEISTCSYLSVDELAEKMILSSKMKLNETKAQLPERPIYLVGWGTGAIIAATVSLTEKVAGLICLGFPILGLSGNRGEGSDPLLQMKHPVLFVIGDRATNCTISLMEKFREELSHLQNNAYIVVIKSGDEYLRVSRRQRKQLLLTQSYVDKSIIDEISEFVNETFTCETRVPIPILPPLILTNSADVYSTNESSLHKPSVRRRLSVNGEPMEGLGLTLAMSKTQEPETDELPKKNRRKSYHQRKSPLSGMEMDLSLPDTQGTENSPQGGESPARASSPKKQRVRIYKPGTGESSSPIGGSSSAIQNPVTFESSGIPPYLPPVSPYMSSAGFSAAQEALASQFSKSFYQYFTGSEASTQYSAAYAHAANQAAAIQHAIAMEAAGGFKQYYSQLEQYNRSASLAYGETEGGKAKKLRKPREMKAKGEKAQPRPRKTKVENFGNGDQNIGHSSIDQNQINSSNFGLCHPGENQRRVSSDEPQSETVGGSSSALMQLLQTKQHRTLTTMSTSSAPISQQNLPVPNIQLPPPSATLALALSFPPTTSYVYPKVTPTGSASTTETSIPLTFTSGSTELEQVFAVKSLPPPLLDEGEINRDNSLSTEDKPLPISTKAEPLVGTSPEKSEGLVSFFSDGKRSPPLLIPTQKSPQNYRIPVRLCLQSDERNEMNLGSGEMETIEASIVIEDSKGRTEASLVKDEKILKLVSVSPIETLDTENLSDNPPPPLVPVRSQKTSRPGDDKPKVQEVEIKLPDGKVKERLRSGDQHKTSVSEVAVENAKNLQVKLPRISVPDKNSPNSSTRHEECITKNLQSNKSKFVKEEEGEEVRNHRNRSKSNDSDEELTKQNKQMTKVSNEEFGKLRNRQKSKDSEERHTLKDIDERKKFKGYDERQKLKDSDDKLKDFDERQKLKDSSEDLTKRKRQKVKEFEDELLERKRQKPDEELEKKIQQITKDSDEEFEKQRTLRKSKDLVEEFRKRNQRKLIDSDEVRQKRLRSNRQRPFYVKELLASSTSSDEEAILPVKKTRTRQKPNDFEDELKKRNQKKCKDSDEELKRNQKKCKDSDEELKRNQKKCKDSDEELKRNQKKSKDSDEELKRNQKKFKGSDEDSKRHQRKLKDFDEDKKRKRLRTKKQRPSYVEEVLTTTSYSSDEELLPVPIKKSRSLPSKTSLSEHSAVVEKKKQGLKRTEGSSTISKPKVMTPERRQTRGSEKKRTDPEPEPELIELDDEEDESESNEDEEEEVDPKSRPVTRSMRLPSTSVSRGEDNFLEEITSGDEEDYDEGNGRRKMRHIFPVTPASLSATRTRKVNIPKFFAYGM